MDVSGGSSALVISGKIILIFQPRFFHLSQLNTESHEGTVLQESTFIRLLLNADGIQYFFLRFLASSLKFAHIFETTHHIRNYRATPID
jgi:hypothetical protein